MNEVRDICHRILERPSPPMPDSALVLAAARRSARRQLRLTVTAGAVVAAAVAAVVAMAGTLHAAAVRTPRPAVLLTAVAIPSLTHTPVRDEPGTRIAALLAQALPAGYHGRPAPGSDRALIVSADRGEGTLSATLVRDGAAAPTGDLCAPGVASRLTPHLPDAGTGCRVIIIDGIPVRVTTTAGASSATRFLAGGFLTVDWSPEGASLFTLDELAALTARMRVAG